MTPQTDAVARFVLVPGFWLGAWAWDRVTPVLTAAGHDVRALTLPGLQGPAAVRAGVTLEDHVLAVLRALEEEPGRPAVLVAHSGAGAPAHMAVDRAPHLVRRVVYVDSGPVPDGVTVNPDLPADAVEDPLPSWEEMQAAGNSLEGLSAADLAEFRERAVPHPAGPAREPVRVSDPRRREVPVTVVASSVRPAQVREWAAAGHPFFTELAHLDATYVDLPTGHWPMWSRPGDLAGVLLQAAR
ncbi:alpha/beta hydrolase [Kineococcus sp. NUM-3379]